MREPLLNPNQPSKRPSGPPARPESPPLARLAAEGGTPGKKISAPLGHTQSGGEPLENSLALRPDPASAHLGHKPGQPPPLLHASQQMGEPLEFFLWGPPDTHNLGGELLEKCLAHRPNLAIAHPGHHPGQPPSLLHASHKRGVPLAKCFQSPLNTHNPGGDPCKIFGAP